MDSLLVYMDNIHVYIGPGWGDIDHGHVYMVHRQVDIDQRHAYDDKLVSKKI